MITIDDAKAMAKRLRSALAETQPNLTHSASLELVARQLGHADWNTASASLARTGMNAMHPTIIVFSFARTTR